MINGMSIISIEPHPSENLLIIFKCSCRKYTLASCIDCMKNTMLYSSMFGFIIVTDKIAGAVIELDRKGAIADEFGWFIYFKSNRGL